MNFSSLLKGAAAALALASVVTLAGCGGDKDAASSTAKSQAAGSKTYIVATRGTFRPFTYVDEKGNLTGYDVEILKEVEKRNPGIHFEYKMMPTSAAFVAIESGQADIVANQVGYTDERAAKTIYTKEVNNYTARKIAVRNDRNDINSLEDLKGKKVAVTTNSEAVRQLQDLNKTYNPPIELIYTDKGFTEGANLVVTGRADATPQYEVSITDAVKTLGLPIKAVGPVISSVPTYFALKKDDDHQKLAAPIDKTLKDMKADGTLKKLSEQFLGKDYTVPQQ